MSTSEKIIKEFLSYLENEKGCSPNTLVSYRTDLNQLSEFVQDDISKTTQKNIKSWLESVKDKFSAISRNRKIHSSFRSFFGYLHKQELILKNPVIGIGRAKTEKKIKDLLTLEELFKFINTPESTRERLVLHLLWEGGRRVGEVARIKKKDVHLEQHTIILRNCKNKQDRVSYFTDTTKNLIKKHLDSITYQADDSSEFLISKKGNPLTEKQILGIVKKTTKKAGITKNISPHTFRHIFNRNYREHGGNFTSLKRIGGWNTDKACNSYENFDNSLDLKDFQRTMGNITKENNNGTKYSR